ncbi:unnamed protein product [Cladocopium goreaui]|uniref:ADF-H domain-containing protein n=1 Tax=Cladocopium goreaui TaxID=2562237 RepID=A0A9P1FTH9_9DINO|nr:unnamed protein product [Cladocopium goreaui]
MADSVDGQLRQTLRAARSRCLRGVKAIVTKKSSSEERYALALANSMPDEGETLDKEFARCVQGLLEPDKPSFLLFRADVSENIDGRWLLLAWLPDVVPEVERLRYVRSRNLLADQLPQPFFLRELLLREAQQLLWSRAAQALRGGDAETMAPRLPPRQEAAEGPVRLSQAAQSLLQRMARREESCLKLIFSGRFSLKQMKTLPTIVEQLSAASQTGPQLEAKAVDCRSPSQLAKAELPSTSCYFALFSREDLVFVHWCPDRMSRDHFTRMRDDSRYAVLKPAVVRLVMDAFDPQVRLLQVDAREAQELVDHANRADERMVADELGSKVLVPQGAAAPSGDCKFPDKGAKADWPLDWPKEVTTPVAMPANLCFFLRPVPYWRGGSKEHTINPNAQNVQNLRSKLARKSLRDQL